MVPVVPDRLFEKYLKNLYFKQNQIKKNQLKLDHHFTRSKVVEVQQYEARDCLEKIFFRSIETNGPCPWKKFNLK